MNDRLASQRLPPSRLADKRPITGLPAWRWAGLFIGLLISFVIGLSAVQMLAVQGLGTAIPLDPTRRLVTTGIYSYIRNPMQLSAALSWVVLGAFLDNIWIAAAAVMAWIFVEGIVRWHHRNDLQQRFPQSWADYRNAVPEWLPLWRPHCTATAIRPRSAADDPGNTQRDSTAFSARLYAFSP